MDWVQLSIYSTRALYIKYFVAMKYRWIWYFLDFERKSSVKFFIGHVCVDTNWQVLLLVCSEDVDFRECLPYNIGPCKVLINWSTHHSDINQHAFMIPCIEKLLIPLIAFLHVWKLPSTTIDTTDRKLHYYDIRKNVRICC